MKFKKRFFKTEKSTFKLLSKSLEKRSKDLATEFSEKHHDAVDFLNKKGIHLDQVLLRGSRGALTGLAAGMVLLSSGLATDKNQQKPTTSKQQTLVAEDIVGEVKGRVVVDKALVAAISKQLPKGAKQLRAEDEVVLTEQISKITGVKVTTELDGNKLNTNIGRIGLEQHLPRYSGETIHNHFDSSPVESVYGRSGLTQNRGAFGYFAPNKFALTQTEVDQEKYYVVVQTFDIPGYKNNVAWYKNRKVMIINPENGKAIVGDIADSGPAKWTGKSYGGSPELMDHLGMYRQSPKTPVLMFFIDESSGSVKLGPV
jgi:hypothetical protein